MSGKHTNPVLLSLFPGVGLFDRAFETEGFCVVRGPDLIFGGDVRKFTPPPGVFGGVFGGPPCQDFSAARNGRAPTGNGLEMLREFARVVSAARPAWWLCENVARVPDVAVDGYSVQRIDLDAARFSGVRRLRHFQFGEPAGLMLDVPRGEPCDNAEPCVTASDGRTFAEVCRLQGLPDGYALPGFKADAAKRAVGNGVPFVLARLIARAIRSALGLPLIGEAPAFDHQAAERRRCGCGCGRPLDGERKTYANATCRKRAHRQRIEPRAVIKGHV